VAASPPPLLLNIYLPKQLSLTIGPLTSKVTIFFTPQKDLLQLLKGQTSLKLKFAESVESTHVLEAYVKEHIMKLCPKGKEDIDLF